MASREWALLREKVHRRAPGGLCERCKMAPIAAVHHLTYIRIGREELEDLQGVCEPCHAFLSAKSDDDPLTSVRRKIERACRVYGSKYVLRAIRAGYIEGWSLEECMDAVRIIGVLQVASREPWDIEAEEQMFASFGGSLSWLNEHAHNRVFCDEGKGH